MSIVNQFIPKYRCFMRVAKNDETYMIIGKIKKGGDSLESCSNISSDLKQNIQNIFELEKQKNDYIECIKPFQNLYFLLPFDLKPQDKRTIITATEEELNKYYRIIKS